MHTMWLRSVLAWPTGASFIWRPIFGGSIGTAATRGANTLLIWQERATQRHMLATLDDASLRDIGLSRADAAREAAKPFWRR